MLIIIIIDYVFSSIFLTQVKLSSVQTLFPIILITTAVSQSNTIQPKMSKFFCKMLKFLIREEVLSIESA